MPCNPLIKDGKTVGFICSRGRQKVVPCIYCGKPSTQLCDFPVEIQGKKTTCDLALCVKCTSQGVSGKTDFCRPHFKLAKEAYERRQAALIISDKIEKFSGVSQTRKQLNQAKQKGCA